MSDRRDFLKTAAGVAGAAMTMNAASYAQVPGAMERIRVGFLGVGGRCQQHIDVVKNLARTDNNVAPVAVCDVWDGDDALSRGTGRGLFPSARKCGLNVDDRNHVSKDYRRILDQRDVDVVCIDAAAAGKHIYCEKPMTKTIDEAHAVVDAARRANVVMTVGVQSMADPTWRMANDMIKRGEIGHVAQAQTSYYRNSTVGQWRYYPLTRSMNPTTVDWDMFLGHRFSALPGVPLAPNMPFDRAIFAQWRCYWDFGGGMYTDLFVHQTTHLIAAMGVRYPARVVGGGGIYLEYDQRTVPDVATVVADYNEGCQAIITATMINDHSIEECIRGHLATLKFGTRTRMEGGRSIREFGFWVLPQSIGDRPAGPMGGAGGEGRFVVGGLVGDDTTALWRNFLGCCRTRTRETLSTPELGAAAFTTVNMGVQSYRQGKVLFWDAERRRPVEADDSWARRWEQRSRERGRPNQIIGWTGGDSGSTLTPPAYQNLQGPWTDGRDPAPAAPVGGR